MRALIWQVLAWDGGADDSLAGLDRSAYGPRAHWASDIATLVAEGLLDRARVLRSCLVGLLRDLPAYHANWFSGLYATLRPTPQEASTDQDLLLRALDSGINATVSLATKQLVAVQRAGLLSSADFLDHCHGPLVGAKSITLAGLRRCCARERNCCSPPWPPGSGSMPRRPRPRRSMSFPPQCCAVG